MKIACLGWGSLIWRSEGLLIQPPWFNDGPFLPIEFVRQSQNGRLTLAITENAKPIQTFWALMTTDDLLTAKMSLLTREGISIKSLDRWIGAVTTNEQVSDITELTIKNWAVTLKLDAVIWTNLPAKFSGVNGRAPTLDNAISYLAALAPEMKTVAEEYIRKTPKQINTEFRRKFESEFGWTPIGS